MLWLFSWLVFKCGDHYGTKDDNLQCGFAFTPKFCALCKDNRWKRECDLGSNSCLCVLQMYKSCLNPENNIFEKLLKLPIFISTVQLLATGSVRLRFLCMNCGTKDVQQIMWDTILDHNITIVCCIRICRYAYASPIT